MRRSTAATVALLLAAPLAGCGSDEAPICQSAQDLKDSVHAVGKVDLTSEGGVKELKSSLQKVQTDLATVRSDATKEFSGQVNAVKSAYDDLKATIKQQREGATGLLPQAAAEAKALGTAVQKLAEDVAKTC